MAEEVQKSEREGWMTKKVKLGMTHVQLRSQQRYDFQK